MLKLKSMAVTGAIASGKSSVCSFLRDYGAWVVHADNIVRRLLSSDAVVVQRVIDLCGPNIVREGKIDREAVANIAFEDESVLFALEAILHPAVREELELERAKAKEAGFALFVAEIPLLFESATPLAKQYDLTVAVVSEEGDCISRYRGGEADYRRRAARQLSSKQKAQRADITIKNQGNLEDLRLVAQNLYKQSIK